MDSTTEAEFEALAKKVIIQCWSTPDICYNIIQLVKNSKFHKRTKHIETKYYFIQEKCAKQELDVAYVNTKDQLADLLTKAISRETLIKLQALNEMQTNLDSLLSK